MSKARPTTGNDGLPLPILPPDRDARVWAKLVRIMFYTPGFMGILLLKTGEPASFGITIELLMLACASAIVGGIFIGTDSTGGGANSVSKVGTASGSLILELLSVVPLLAALPGLFHELAHSTLLHTRAPGAVDIALGYSELLPMVAILPFMLYQLAGFGTLSFVVSKAANWVINIGIFCLIVGSYIFYREGDYAMERRLSGILVLIMAVTVLYSVLKLIRMQTKYDEQCPTKKDEK
jgi:hypothetical protein